MAYFSSAPTPLATTRLAANPHAGVVTSTGTSTGPVTLPATGQQWPLPIL